MVVAARVMVGAAMVAARGERFTIGLLSVASEKRRYTSARGVSG